MKLIWQFSFGEGNITAQPERFKKIIATEQLDCTGDRIPVINDVANMMLRLPQLPESFIQYFVEQYNKGNVITKVMIECEWFMDRNGTKPYHVEDSGECVNEVRLKANSDNTINWKPIKDSWTRDEIIEALNESYVQGSVNRDEFRQRVINKLGL